MITIVIPTFNNLEYLKLCLNSLRKNSKYNHEIKLHINDGSDGTLDFAIKNKINFTHTKENVGLCSALNQVCAIITNDYILYAHDDMYFCPNWDVSLMEEIKNIKHDHFFLSGTLIEAYTGHIKFNCGVKLSDFDEKKLLSNYKTKNFYDYQGSHYAPHLISKKIWDKVGGFSEEFNPGVASDPDFNMKLWREGIRIFKGLNNFKVYHFASIVINKINVHSKNEINIKSRASKIFLLKWGISIKFFKKFYLKTNTKYTGPLSEPKKNLVFFINLFICKINLLYLKLFYKKLYFKN